LPPKINSTALVDKFKIRFECVKAPKPFVGLNGYEQGSVYQGRKYNGMYEISVKWGNGEQTKLIERKLFSEFFQEIDVNEDNKDKRNMPLCV
jgi:hypothetical protein